MLSTIVGALFIFIACSAFLFLEYLRYKARQALSWPDTEGLIIQSKMISDQRGDWDESVVYEYHVEQKKYENRDVSFFTWTSYSPLKTLKKYKKGSSVRVYYNPNNPADSVLELSQNLIYPARVKVALIVFLLFGVYAIYHGL